MFSICTIVTDAKEQCCLSCKALWLCCAKLWECYCNRCRCQYSLNKQPFSLACWEYELNTLKKTKRNNNVGFKISGPGRSVSFTGLCTENRKFKHDCLLHTVTSAASLYTMWVHWQELTGSSFLKGGTADRWLLSLFVFFFLFKMFHSFDQHKRSVQRISPILSYSC